jgi:hypothetical protein
MAVTVNPVTTAFIRTALPLHCAQAGPVDYAKTLTQLTQQGPLFFNSQDILPNLPRNSFPEGFNDMAFATINFEHPQSGQVKQAPVGFSWTTLIFGLFPALLRGHWVMAAVILVLAMLTLSLSSIVFAFIYNKMYIKYLIGEGFKAASATHDMSQLQQQIGQPIPSL